MRAQGEKGEALAEQYLVSQGFRVLARNYRARHKEIDIIAEDAETLAFIEVKYYKENSLRDVHAAVDRQKQKNVIAAARHYLAKQNITERFIRFDVVLIEHDMHSAVTNIELFKDAFRP
jgi:putative endonuclease